MIKDQLVPAKDWIIENQNKSGSIYWDHRGKCDPWDHCECLIALAIYEEWDAFNKGIEWFFKNLNADGIKTGYLSYEKYSLASSINRKGRRLIAVGSGFNSKNSRSKESTKLLTYGLTNFDLVNISKANETFDKLDVWLGKDDKIDVHTNEDVYKTIKKAKKKLLKISKIILKNFSLN